MRDMMKMLAAVGALLLLVVGPVLAQGAVAKVKPNSIQALDVVSRGGDIVLKVDFQEALEAVPSGFSISKPARIVLDFAGVTNGLGRSQQVVNQGDLTTVNVIQADQRTRMVLNLSRLTQHTTAIDGKSLIVTLRSATGEATVSGDTPSTMKSVRFSESALGDVKHSVNDITFRRGKDGEGRVVVDLSDSRTGIDIKQQGQSLVVDFAKTSAPSTLLRRLDVTDFATPVVSVVTVAQGDNIRMTITPKGLWEHYAYQSDKQFVVEVRPIIEDPNKLVQGSKTGYQGPLVSINYQNGDVRALLRLMAEELGLSAVISETVTGSTTLVLKDVPADQVIDIIFRQKSLDMRKNGNVLLIAPREELALKDKLEYESRQQIGELEPMQMEAIQLNYQKAADVARLLNGFQGQGGASGPITRLLSKRGSVTAEPVTNTIFVTDIAAKREEIRRFVKTIDIGSRQVLIEARVVEANDDFNKNIGVRMSFLNRVTQQLGNTGVAFGGGSYSVTPGTLQADRIASASNSGYSDLQTWRSTYRGSQQDANTAGVNLPSFSNAGGGLAFSLFNTALTKILNVELAALESDGRGKVVSSPKVVTANNVPAKIEDGFEVPYEVCSAQGCVVAFKSANLSLEATPQITPDGKVKMKLQVVKAEPDWSKSVRGVPPIKMSRVDTDVVVDNGGTVVIGGVFILNSTKNTERVPLLGDLPGIGFLFRTTQDTSTKRELLIFITPRIITDRLSAS